MPERVEIDTTELARAMESFKQGFIALAASQADRKCCPGHVMATNRRDRRRADRLCPCRGECGRHSTRPALETSGEPHD